MTKSRKIALRLFAIFIIFGVIPFTGIYFAQGAFVFPVPQGGVGGAGEAAGRKEKVAEWYQVSLDTVKIAIEYELRSN